MFLRWVICFISVWLGFLGQGAALSRFGYVLWLDGQVAGDWLRGRHVIENRDDEVRRREEEEESGRSGRA